MNLLVLVHNDDSGGAVPAALGGRRDQYEGPGTSATIRATRCPGRRDTSVRHRPNSASTEYRIASLTTGAPSSGANAQAKRAAAARRHEITANASRAARPTRGNVLTERGGTNCPACAAKC